MIKFLDRIKARSNLFSKKVDKYQEAVTYAEAGLPEDAQRLFKADQESVDERQGKLLVVGRESRFSEESIKYALDMSSETLDAAFSRNKVCSEFRRLSEENVKPFKEMAEKLSIPFSHVVKFCERDTAVEEITKEFKDVEFVISDTEEERPTERVEQGERPRPRMYVYSMLR